MIHLQKMMATLVDTQAGPKALSKVNHQLASQQTEVASQSMDIKLDYPETNQMIDLVSLPKIHILNSTLIPPSNLKMPPPLQPFLYALKLVNSIQIKVTSISMSSILIQLSKRHFGHYKNFTQVSFKQLSLVVDYAHHRWMLIVYLHVLT